MESRRKTAEFLDHIVARKVRHLASDVAMITAHLHEGQADDFSDLHEIDKRSVLERVEQAKKRMDDIKRNLDTAVAFLRRG